MSREPHSFRHFHSCKRIRKLAKFMAQFQNHLKEQPALIDINSEEIIRWDPEKREKATVTAAEFEQEAQFDEGIEAGLASAEIFQAGYLELWHSLFPCQPGAASEISLMLAKSRFIVYNERRKSTYSKADAPKRDYLPLNERRLFCGPDRSGIIFFACSSYLCRERQATPQSSCQRTLAEPISL